MGKVVSKMQYVYIIVCSSMVKVVLKLRYVYVIMCSSVVKVISKARNIDIIVFCSMAISLKSCDLYIIMWSSNGKSF